MTHQRNETPEPLAQEQAGEMPPVAWRYHCGKVTHLTSSKLDHYFSLDEGETYVKGEALVRLSDATAALQAKDAEIARLKADAGRLDFILKNDAFKHATRTDAGGIAYQLMSQDEDEDYEVLSGEGKFFPSPRDAIDAAIRARTGGEG